MLISTGDNLVAKKSNVVCISSFQQESFASGSPHCDYRIKAADWTATAAAAVCRCKLAIPLATVANRLWFVAVFISSGLCSARSENQVAFFMVICKHVPVKLLCWEIEFPISKSDRSFKQSKPLTRNKLGVLFDWKKSTKKKEPLQIKRVLVFIVNAD